MENMKNKELLARGTIAITGDIIEYQKIQETWTETYHSNGYIRDGTDVEGRICNRTTYYTRVVGQQIDRTTIPSYLLKYDKEKYKAFFLRPINTISLSHAEDMEARLYAEDISNFTIHHTSEQLIISPTTQKEGLLGVLDVYVKGHLLQLQSERWIISIYRGKIRINEISKLYTEEFEKEIWQDIEAYGSMSFESVREERHTPYSLAGESIIDTKWITATLGIFKLVDSWKEFNIADELSTLPYHLYKHEILTSPLLWRGHK